jgi:hypothetical protein
MVAPGTQEPASHLPNVMDINNGSQEGKERLRSMVTKVTSVPSYFLVKWESHDTWSGIPLGQGDTRGRIANMNSSNEVSIMFSYKHYSSFYDEYPSQDV